MNPGQAPAIRQIEQFTLLQRANSTRKGAVGNFDACRSRMVFTKSIIQMSRTICAFEEITINYGSLISAVSNADKNAVY